MKRIFALGWMALTALIAPNCHRGAAGQEDFLTRDWQRVDSIFDLSIQRQGSGSFGRVICPGSSWREE